MPYHNYFITGLQKLGRGVLVPLRQPRSSFTCISCIYFQIMDHGPQLSWDDIAGLEFAKKTIKEIVVWPMLRP